MPEEVRQRKALYLKGLNEERERQSRLEGPWSCAHRRIECWVMRAAIATGREVIVSCLFAMVPQTIEKHHGQYVRCFVP
jgi:hypothetical protein